MASRSGQVETSQKNSDLGPQDRRDLFYLGQGIPFSAKRWATVFAKNHRAFLDVTGHSQYHEPTLPLNLCRIMIWPLICG